MSKIYVDEIRHSGGAVAAMQLDSGGVVAEPNKEYFHVDLTANQSALGDDCLLYTSPSPRDRTRSRMPSSA